MFTEKDVKYTANLSRIHLTNEEIAKLTKNLEDVLQYIKKLEKLDVANVEPTSHALPLKNVYRDDIATPSLSQDEVMKLTKEKHHGSFKVPKVIE